MDEVQIIHGLRACSAEAHEALYDTYAGDLYDYCHALLQDDAAAAAAVRETLLRAAASMESMPDGCTLRAWLYALARGQCRAGGERMIEHPMPEDDPSARLLITVLGALTARDREVLELTGRHGLNEADLEPVLGLPADRVGSLLADARRRFDQAMAEELDRTGPVAYPSLAELSEGEDPLALLYRALPRPMPPSGQRPRILDDLLIAGTTGTVPAAFTTDRSASASSGAEADTAAGASRTAGAHTGAATSEIATHARPRRKRGLLIGGVVAAAVVLVGGVVFGVARFTGTSPDPAAAAPTSPSQPGADPTALPTGSRPPHTGDVKYRNTPGGTSTPTGSPSAGPSRHGHPGDDHRTSGRPARPHTSAPPEQGARPPGTSRVPPRPTRTSRPPTHTPTHDPDPTPTPTPTPSETAGTNSATPTG